MAAAPAAVDSGEDGPAADPKAVELLVDMAKYLQAAKELTFHADILYDDVVLGNVKVEYGASLDVAVRRPDRLHVDYVGDQSERRFWYDGTTATLYAGLDDVFATVPAQPTIDETLDRIREEFDVALPLANLVYNKLEPAVLERVEFGFYLGLHEVDGIRCHHLLLINEDVQWQVWIEDGKQLVPRKIVITYASEPQKPRYAAVLSDWDLSARLPDRLFVADPPESASKIDFLPVQRAGEEEVEADDGGEDK